MSPNFESQSNNLDDLLNDFDRSTNSNELFSQIDELCNVIDQGFDGRREEIISWSVDIKRKQATDSQDPFVLGLLAVDENFNVRSLAACNPNVPVPALRRLVEASDDYMKLIIANNPSCPSDILDRITELTGEREVLGAVQLHPNTSAVTKYRIAEITQAPTDQYQETYVSP